MQKALIVICAGGERKRDVRIARAMQKGHHLILQCRILLVRATAAGRRRMRARWAVCISRLLHPIVFSEEGASLPLFLFLESALRGGGGDCCAGLWAVGVGRPVALSHSSRIVKTLHLDARRIVQLFGLSLCLFLFYLFYSRVQACRARLFSIPRQGLLSR